MAAPTFVRGSYGRASGATVTATFGGATSAGNLLLLAASTVTAQTIATPSGWTLDMGPEPTADMVCYVFSRISDGLTTVDLTPSNQPQLIIWASGEYSLPGGLAEAAYVKNLQPAVSPGFATGPARSYGAGPRVVFGACFADGGPQGADAGAVTAPGTLRNSIPGATWVSKEIYFSDSLLDTTAGSTSWNYINTDLAGTLSVSIAYLTSVPLVTCDSPVMFDVYSLGTATTPALTYLATLCDAFGKGFRIEKDGTGSGKFSINRSSADCTAAILGDGDGDVRFVQVRVPGMWGTTPHHGFFIEEGDFRLLDENEEGGQTLTFSGHGSLAYLDFAKVAAHSYITREDAIDDITDTGAIIGMDPFTGVMRLYLASTGSKPGQMLGRTIGEIRAYHRPQHPVPLITIDFTYALDSNGAAWASSAATDEFSASIGESVLSVVGRLIGSGAITVQMSPAFLLSAYNTFGTNRASATYAAGKVRFVGGDNIAVGLSRQVRPTRVATHELVYGEQETSVVSALADAATRVTREAFLSASGTDATALTAVGAADLAERQLRSESISIRIALGADDATGLYLPGPAGSTAGKFWVGDTVTLHTGTGEFDFNNASFVVAAINVEESDAAVLATDLAVTVELGSMALPPASGSADGGSVGLTPGTLSASPGGGSSIVPVHSHPSSVTTSAWKDPVRAASTGNITLSAPGATIDGVTMAMQERFLAKDQTAGAANGIYVWLGAAVAAARAPDFGSGSAALGAMVHVTEGTVNADTVWQCTTNAPITLGTTALTFEAFPGSAASDAVDLPGGLPEGRDGEIAWLATRPTPPSSEGAIYLTQIAT